MFSSDASATPPSGNCSFSPGNETIVSTGRPGQPHVSGVEGTFTELQQTSERTASLPVVLRSAGPCLGEESSRL